MVGGFNDYANLRLRDHRPGNGQYELPPVFGPKSDSSKRSILRKYPPSQTEVAGAGPGDYAIPSCIGTGRASRFGPPLEMDERGNPIFPATAAPSGAAEGSVEIHPAARQYSMALTPDTPAYSIYGKLPGAWEKSATGPVGPGEYSLPSAFQRRGWGVPEGAHFGTRPLSAEEREKLKIPGPGTYNLKRFGDDVPAAREPPLCTRRRRRCDPTPGPGAYEDPTTIAVRTRAPRLRMVATSTFGRRWGSRRLRAVAPGPNAYNTNTPAAMRLLERKQRHAPRFVRPAQRAADGEKDKSRDPGYTLPSDFDYHYKKGKSMMGRWHDRPPPRDSAGPGSYDTSNAVPPPTGGRFAAAPFDPYASQRAAAEAQAKAGLSGGLGPASYDLCYTQVDRHRKGALFGTGIDTRGDDNGVPGPGHYHPNYDIKEPENKGTVFYKGSFSGGDGETPGGGPGAHYNDYTMYSQSLAGDCASGKGFTMRSRYPARATHQVCKPYDETTNINCVYPDELTWETKVTLPPVSGR